MLRSLLAVCPLLLVVACQGADDTPGNSGGFPNTQGGSPTGGVPAQGGTPSSTGGTSPSTGGTTPGGSGGSASGSGGTASGGSSGAGVSGGTVNGGAPGEGGGAGGSAGTTPTGGGGAANGGGNGGKAQGGSGGTAAGGAAGAKATGGTATGGTSGAATGGSATGGTATGGTGGQVGLPSGVSALFPANKSQGVCPDPPLRISFASPPSLGTAGKIQVFNASGGVVASVDMASTNVTDTIGGTTFTIPRRVYVDGNDAVIYLKTKALSYGQTYYVTVDSGAIRPPGGGTLAITDSNTWRFSTAAAAPSNVSALTVSLSGAGNFCSVQGALDALPSGNNTASRITINSGTYYEIVHSSGKNNVTLHGQDRKATIIAGTNNNNLNASTATRSLIGFDNTKGLVIENLTIKNLTPQGGSQAEALRLQGCDQCVVRSADIISLQDTLLWSGKIYATDCYIAGNVDFIWGNGAVYFNKCEIKTIGRAGYNVQSRNAAGAYGYVFVDSKLTADSGITGNVLARIDVSTYPGSHVAYINCQMGSHISAAGWVVTGGSPTSSLRFWEYQSTDASGNALNVSGRLSGLTPITSAQAAMMRDPSVVLGGWQPPQ
ncbi:MAG TPA: pectinesterase family protein [Polyangiaceae bacterium]|nr:pectinesterase family protein [Polyangiaceae bacterium]